MTSLRSSLKWGRLSHVGVWICSTLIYRVSIIFSDTLSLLIKSSLLVKSPWLNRKSVVWFWNILTTKTNKVRPVRWWSCWASLRIASPSRPHPLAAQNHRGWRWCDRCLGGLIQFAGYMIHIHKTIKTKVCMEKDGKNICENYNTIYIYEQVLNQWMYGVRGLMSTGSVWYIWEISMWRCLSLGLWMFSQAFMWFTDVFGWTTVALNKTRCDRHGKPHHRKEPDSW